MKGDHLMTKKPKLTDLDLVLLSNAAARPDGMLLPPPASVRARGKTLEKALAKLLRHGMVEECATTSPDQAWRAGEDGRGIGLRIVEAGREALGLGESSDPADGAAPRSAKADEGFEATESETPPVTERSSEADVPHQSAPFAPGVKPGTKQARLVDLLSRPWGMGITDLSRLLGWQPHTVRAALSGLRKKGYAVTGTKDENGTIVYRATPPARAADDA